LPVLLRHVRSAGERLKGSRGAERAIQTQRIRGFFRAIGQVGSKAIPHLVDLLDFPDAQIRYFAARTLTDLDADARDVQSGLRRLLNDEEPAIRYFARWAIGKLDERRGAEHRSGVAGK
ncbi:MAG: HEAT repeat domain-containing protein, partial [Planctomycetes bacterium]|nr:HEAT repeat domain-containing protein [Planctomycetota bacterium]